MSSRGDEHSNGDCPGGCQGHWRPTHRYQQKALKGISGPWHPTWTLLKANNGCKGGSDDVVNVLSKGDIKYIKMERIKMLIY